MFMNLGSVYKNSDLLAAFAIQAGCCVFGWGLSARFKTLGFFADEIVSSIHDFFSYSVKLDREIPGTKTK
jgi:hypothetical protein